MAITGKKPSEFSTATKNALKTALGIPQLDTNQMSAVSGAANPSASNVFATAADLPPSMEMGAILSSNGTYKGLTITATVDTNGVGFGAVLAQSADFHFDEADADAVAQVYMLAMALETSTGTKKLLLKGQICNTGWSWNAGPVYLSTTQGTLTQTPPSGTDDVVLIVGWALSATCVFFSPYASYVEHA